jgi:peptidoglycan/xylan/chitin deacetylase (PgdA/CDA1 family)
VRSKFVRHGLILGYHRINRLAWDPFRLAVSPENFTQQLDILQKHANVIPQHELADARTRGEIPPRSVAITFDDGYADHLSITQPLLQQAGLPSTIFISTGYLGREFWWDTLASLVSSINPANPLTVDADGSKFEWRPESVPSSHDRRSLLLDLHRFLMPLSLDECTECLEQLAESSGVTINEKRDDLAMTETELKQLASDDLTEIGCHTVSHPMMARLEAGQQHSEVMQSKQTLEALTGQPVLGFSFPYGSQSAASVQLVEKCGFTYACASHKDVVWRNSNPFRLPRIWIPDCTGDRFLKLIRHWL